MLDVIWRQKAQTWKSLGWGSSSALSISVFWLCFLSFFEPGSTACGIFLDQEQRLNRCPLQWEHGVLTTGVRAKLLQLCQTLCNPMDCSPSRLLCPWGFSKQEYWSGLSYPPLGDLPDLGIEPVSLTPPALAGRFFTTSATGEALNPWTTMEAPCQLSDFNSSKLLIFPSAKD